ncbi:MAG TPA: YbfB/YjiJ family MFS transporter [Stellaceae bacterium]|jgi:predicted MFS family arabinose efflux permease|nr:YbfB/YjiJ family MFS transporter [Stellaceae bacterium]
MRVWRAALAASAAGLVGIGFARFAYTPLIPALIEAHWFTASAAVYFGAANLAGYLLGAVTARAMAKAVPTATLLRLMLVMVTLSFFASAWPFAWLWFFVWRFLSGVGGAVIMVVTAPNVLAHVAPERRGLVGGVIFAGVGAGVALSGTLVPVLVRWGLVETWCVLGGFCVLLTAGAWNGFLPDPAPPIAGAAAPKADPSWGGIVVAALLLEYALLASGLVPHMVFFVDYIARGLGWGIAAGGWYWVLFGLGAVFGPLLGGPLGDRIGFGVAMRAGLALEAAAVAMLLVTANGVALGVSGFLGGFLTAGFVPVVVGRVHVLLHDVDRQRTVWAAATACFALGQASAGYLDSYLFSTTNGSYTALFVFGTASALLALAIDLGAALYRPRPRPIQP